MQRVEEMVVEKDAHSSLFRRSVPLHVTNHFISYKTPSGLRRFKMAPSVRKVLSKPKKLTKDRKLPSVSPSPSSANVRREVGKAISTLTRRYKGTQFEVPLAPFVQALSILNDGFCFKDSDLENGIIDVLVPKRIKLKDPPQEVFVTSKTEEPPEPSRPPGPVSSVMILSHNERPVSDPNRPRVHAIAAAPATDVSYSRASQGGLDRCNADFSLSLLLPMAVFLIQKCKTIPSEKVTDLWARVPALQKSELFIFALEVSGKVSESTLATYMQVLGSFCSYILDTFPTVFNSLSELLTALRHDPSSFSTPVKSYCLARLSKVRYVTLTQQISALNHVVKALCNGRTLYALFPSLGSFLTSGSKFFHRDAKKKAGRPMEMKRVFKLFQFCQNSFKSVTEPPPHASFSDAVVFLAWFGPRTSEARKLKWTDVSFRDPQKKEVLVVIYRAPKTGTDLKPDQYNYMSRFSPQNEAVCPVRAYERLLLSKHPNSRTVFHSCDGSVFKADRFSSLWREVFDTFGATFSIAESHRYTFYTFRNSLCIYLALYCEFSYELVSQATRHRGTRTTEKCYVSKGQHLARQRLASLVSKVDHGTVVNATPQFQDLNWKPFK